MISLHYFFLPLRLHPWVQFMFRNKCASWRSNIATTFTGGDTYHSPIHVGSSSSQTAPNSLQKWTRERGLLFTPSHFKAALYLKIIGKCDPLHTPSNVWKLFWICKGRVVKSDWLLFLVELSTRFEYFLCKRVFIQIIFIFLKHPRHARANKTKKLIS